MRFIFWIIVGMMLFMIGCASNLKVTYYSDPPGALLYEGQKRIGHTPVTLSYQITKENKRLGYVVLRGTQVYWASGASASIPSLKADLSMGTKQQFTFFRPQDSPGHETDIQFSRELDANNCLNSCQNSYSIATSVCTLGCSGAGAGFANCYNACANQAQINFDQCINICTIKFRHY